MRCWGELVMGAIFRICGNKSQPGLQLDEKLATHLKSREFSFKVASENGQIISTTAEDELLTLVSPGTTACQ